MPLHPRDVGEDDAVARVFEARREGLRHFQQHLLRRLLAGDVAVARDELRHDRARLRERHAGADRFLTRPPRGRHDMHMRAAPFDDHQRLFAQIGLGAQPRRQWEQRNEKAGQPGHATSAFVSAGVSSAECRGRGAGGVTGTELGFTGLVALAPRHS